MELWEGLTAIVLILVGISLLVYSIRGSMKESKTAPQPKVYCSSCRTENSPEADSCVKCGKKIGSQHQSPSGDKSEEKDAQDNKDSGDDIFFPDEKDMDLIFPEDGI